MNEISMEFPVNRTLAARLKIKCSRRAFEEFGKNWCRLMKIYISEAIENRNWRVYYQIVPHGDGPWLRFTSENEEHDDAIIRVIDSRVVRKLTNG